MQKSPSEECQPNKIAFSPLRAWAAGSLAGWVGANPGFRPAAAGAVTRAPGPGAWLRLRRLGQDERAWPRPVGTRAAATAGEGGPSPRVTGRRPNPRQGTGPAFLQPLPLAGCGAWDGCGGSGRWEVAKMIKKFDKKDEESGTRWDSDAHPPPRGSLPPPAATCSRGLRTEGRGRRCARGPVPVGGLPLAPPPAPEPPLGSRAPVPEPARILGPLGGPAPAPSSAPPPPSAQPLQVAPAPLARGGLLAEAARPSKVAAGVGVGVKEARGADRVRPRVGLRSTGHRVCI